MHCAAIFPFYGEIETVPAVAFAQLKNGSYALLDEPLANQYAVSQNDSIKSWATLIFKVADVRKFPGGSGCWPRLIHRFTSIITIWIPRVGAVWSRWQNVFYKTATEDDA